jgi:M6 family metalloprotease-like protein
MTFNRKRVMLVGELVGVPREGIQAQSMQAIQARSIELDRSEDAAAFAAEVRALAVTGSQPWVTILCRFADSTGVTPHDVGYFNTLMGSSYLDRYWREVSYDDINLTGSAVFGWYNLPQPKSHYVDNTGAKLDLLANDCTAVADADVFFPNFTGINLMFNDTLDGFAWGGSNQLNKDGQSKHYGITWIPVWGHNQHTLAHEMGHGLGLSHSSGPYGVPYDSSWDVMSGSGGTCVSSDAIYGCNAPHTISYHKDILGWIPSSRKFVPAPGVSETIVLERLGQPVSGSNYLMAQIPIGGSSTQFYTVEARRFAGYDTNVPGEAVVIHNVDTTRGRPAQVVDIDGDGDPNDAVAMWTAGETFIDVANAITVSVNSVSSSSFDVTVTLNSHILIITSGPSGSPNPMASGGTANLSVTAQDSLGHPLTYTWTASCPGALGSHGNFNNASLQNPTWTAPTNPTGSQQTCTMQVMVSDGLGLSEVRSYAQGVSATAPGARLTNISTRSRVQTGDDVMIAGFIIGGTSPKTVLVRAIGPSLANFNVPGALANPVVTLFAGQSAIAENDDWQTSPQAAAIAANGLAPSHPLEAAILITLNPGSYTAIVSGFGGTTGVGLIEVFEVTGP